MTQLYLSKGIKTAIHLPIEEHNEKELKMKVFAASQYLNDMVNNKGHRVYIHCSAGITRAPTVVLLYLCLFKRHKSWRDIDQVDQYLSSHYVVSYPNRQLVSQIIKDNHEF
jgi:protein-tyrosine phosphatase